MRLHTIWVSDHIIISVPEHAHHYYQLMICRDGSGEIGIGESRYRISAGDVCLAKPNQKHLLIQDDSMRLCEIKFIVEDRHLDEKLRRLPDSFKITDDFLYDRVDCIRREFYNEDFYAVEVVNEELFLLLVYMMRSALSEDDKHQNSLTEIVAMTSGDLDINAERRLALVVEYIETHISDDITLEVLSEKFHFDKSYLTVKFKELWGCSPMRYVARARLERAKALLLGSSLSVTDIASKVGFTSIHYFSRYFKAKYGISPAEYRSVSKRKNISKK